LIVPIDTFASSKKLTPWQKTATHTRKTKRRKKSLSPAAAITITMSAEEVGKAFADHWYSMRSSGNVDSLQPLFVSVILSPVVDSDRRGTFSFMNHSAISPLTP
jgi:hypothetical protein